MVCVIVKYLVIGVVGLGYEEVFIYLLNFVWLNIFEMSFYVIGGVMDVIEVMRFGIGFGVVLSYVL